MIRINKIREIKTDEDLKEEKLVFANKVIDILEPYIIKRNKKIVEFKNSFIEKLNEIKDAIKENKKTFDSLVKKYEKRKKEKELIDLIEKILSEKKLTKEQRNDIKITLKVLNDLSIQKLNHEINELKTQFKIV